MGRQTGHKVRKQPFRMPLDAENGKAVVCNTFYDAVIGSLDDGQVLSEGIYGLMMVRCCTLFIREITAVL